MVHTPAATNNVQGKMTCCLGRYSLPGICTWVLMFTFVRISGRAAVAAPAPHCSSVWVELFICHPLITINPIILIALTRLPLLIPSSRSTKPFHRFQKPINMHRPLHLLITRQDIILHLIFLYPVPSLKMSLHSSHIPKTLHSPRTKLNRTKYCLSRRRRTRADTRLYIWLQLGI